MSGLRIARVFPTKTSMCPSDKDAYFGEPDLFTPKYDEVHISVTFTWDIPKAIKLRYAWRNHGTVLVGGPAYNSDGGYYFESGKYLKRGITITSRGCPNNCGFCFVPTREGRLRELPIAEGNIIQDNNILACSTGHWHKVLAMLKKQKAIEFKGGLEAIRVTADIAEDLRSLRIKTLWLACDHVNSIKPLEFAVKNLYKAGFTRNHIYCYVLLYGDMLECEQRLRKVYELGAMPFGQLYRDKDDSIKYSKEWKQFARRWSRPAIYKSHLQLFKKG